MELAALTAFVAPFGPHDCKEAFPWGAQVTLRAESPGPWFRSWEGDGCSQKGDCILNMRRPAAVTAHFERWPA